MHFHPDRVAGNRPILIQMADEGVYRSQFVTGTSNGGLTAHPGGDRWRWESRIFAGAYDDAAPDQRPVYGALNYRSDPISGNAGPIWVPRRERSTGARVDGDGRAEPVPLGSAAHPAGSAGLPTAAVSIGSGRDHVIQQCLPPHVADAPDENALHPPPTVGNKASTISFVTKVSPSSSGTCTQNAAEPGEIHETMTVRE